MLHFGILWVRTTNGAGQQQANLIFPAIAPNLGRTRILLYRFVGTVLIQTR